MYRALFVSVLLHPVMASAEPPWVIALGAGPGVHRITENYSPTPDDFTAGAAARLEVGYRVTPTLALGAHLGGALVHARTTIDVGMPDVPSTYVPLELGLAPQLVVANRILVAPWFGIHDLQDYRSYAAGLAVAVDVHVSGRDRVGLMASATYARHEDSTGELQLGYTGFTAGISYRYW